MIPKFSGIGLCFVIQIQRGNSQCDKTRIKIFGFSRGSTSIEGIICTGLEEAIKRNYVVFDHGTDRVIIKE